MNRTLLYLFGLGFLCIFLARAAGADSKTPAQQPPKAAKAAGDVPAAKQAPRSQDQFKKASELLLDAQRKLRTLEAETAERRRGLEARLAELERERQGLERSGPRLSSRIAELEKELETKKETSKKDAVEVARLTQESASVVDEAKKFLARLDKLVQDGIAWRQEPRKEALARARAALSEPDVAPKSAVEIASRVEADEESLGRTIEAGRVQIEVGGEQRSVPAVRLGLLAVAYASEDASVVGYAHTGQGAEQGKIEAGSGASGESAADKALEKVAAGYSSALAVLQRKLSPRLVDLFIPSLPVGNEARQ